MSWEFKVRYSVDKSKVRSENQSGFRCLVKNNVHRLYTQYRTIRAAHLSRHPVHLLVDPEIT